MTNNTAAPEKSQALARKEENQAALNRMLKEGKLPGVITSNRYLRDTAEDALNALVAYNQPERIFVRAGRLVRIGTDEDGRPKIEEISASGLKGVLARAANFVKLSGEDARPSRVAPPDNVVDDIMSRGSWPFPPLEGIVEVPVLRPDGTVLDQPGYDSATRLVYIPSSEIPPIPENPTRGEVNAALRLIWGVIGDFPYEDDYSRANALGLFLTPIIRQALAGRVPLGLIDATRQGTGKSLLGDALAIIATGRSAAMFGAPRDDAEWSKRITSVLGEGATVVVIDNVRYKLDSSALDRAITASIWKERLMGTNDVPEYKNRAVWIATGNNMQIGGDLPRRCYKIRLDARMAQPWTRDVSKFHYDLETWLPEHRGEVIAALLTLARAWYAAGHPLAEGLPNLGGFQGWVNVVGSILEFVGVKGFLGNLEQLWETADDGTAQWAEFLRAIRNVFSDLSFEAKDLARYILDAQSETGKFLKEALPDELSDYKPENLQRRLGKAFSRYEGTRFDDENPIYLSRAGKNKHDKTVKWSVRAEYAECARGFKNANPAATNPPPEPVRTIPAECAEFVSSAEDRKNTPFNTPLSSATGARGDGEKDSGRVAGETPQTPQRYLEPALQAAGRYAGLQNTNHSHTPQMDYDAPQTGNELDPFLPDFPDE